jgi:1-deoxy-D-xylulose-5-phosphate reductoisomerase
MVKRLVVLGSTGSIGRQTLDVVRAHPSEFAIVGLAAGTNRSLLLEQAREFRPQLLFCQADIESAELPSGCRLVPDVREMVAAPGVDLVLQGMVGNAGLLPTLEALRRGVPVALANKEPIVIAGELLTAEARRSGAAILPVDSEPSAIWQCLHGEDGEQGVRRLLITASGGPFRKRPLKEMADVSPEEALQHPTWKMGTKITVDSATLMNKGFEVIEAHWLFGIPWEQVEVVVHPQSIIHSMVEFTDGSVKAQLGPPDMRLPIQYALFYPQRRPNGNLPRFDPFATKALTFEPLDPQRYPCFTLAVDAGRRGGTCPAVLSAADEVAVHLFLQRRIGFMDIPRLVRQALDEHTPVANPTVEDVLAADAWARDALLGSVAGVR